MKNCFSKLLIILVLVVFNFFSSPVLAQSIPECNDKTLGEFLGGPFLKNEVDPICVEQKGAGCFSYNRIDDTYDCYKIKEGAAAVPGTVTGPSFPDSTTTPTTDCPDIKFDENGYYTHHDMNFQLIFNWDKTDPKWKYYIKVTDSGFPEDKGETQKVQITKDTVVQNLKISNGVGRAGSHRVTVQHDSGEDVCQRGNLSVFSEEFAQVDKAACSIKIPDNVEVDKPFTIDINTKPISHFTYHLFIAKKPAAAKIELGKIYGNDHELNDTFNQFLYLSKNQFQINYKNDDSSEKVDFLGGGSKAKYYRIPLGDYTMLLNGALPDGKDSVYCSKHDFTVSKNATTDPTLSDGTAAPGSPDSPKTKTTIAATSTDCSGSQCSSSSGHSCDPKNDPKGVSPSSTGGVLTAIGCIPTDPKVLVNSLMGFSISLGGGIALLLMIFGSFQMLTSAGNPEAIKKGQQQMTSAVVGLLFIIFSTLLLKIIGADILSIPGFG